MFIKVFRFDEMFFNEYINLLFWKNKLVKLFIINFK